MCIDIQFEIKFFSDWHCGAGLTAGADTDSLVITNEQGLPYVPGKTIKGLIKDTALDISDYNPKFLNQNMILDCFGSYSEDKNKEDKNIQGKCFFSNANLSGDIQKKLITYEGKEKIEFLFRKISSTSIDKKTGVAKDKSLRSTQVAIPLNLFGELKNIPAEHVDDIIKCMKMIKHAGVNRNRGLGRCSFNVIDRKENTNA